MLAAKGRLFPGADIESFQFFKSLFPNAPARAGDATQPLVMKDHHVTVFGELAIQLDHIRASFNRFFKSEPGVFRELSGCASVRDLNKTSHDSWSKRSETRFSTIEKVLASGLPQVH